MKDTKRFWLYLLTALLAASMVLTGCGKGEEQNSSEDTYSDTLLSSGDDAQSNADAGDSYAGSLDNAALAGDWYHSESEATLYFDGYEIYTAVDAYGALAGNYYFDGSTLELYGDDGITRTGYIDADGFLVLNDSDGYYYLVIYEQGDYFGDESEEGRGDYFGDESEEGRGDYFEDESTDEPAVNLSDFYGSWAYTSGYGWLVINGDGSYEFWKSGEGPRYYTYFFSGEAIRMQDIGETLFMREDGVLYNSRGETLTRCDESEVGDIGKGDVFEDENEGRGDVFDEATVTLEGNWEHTDGDRYLSFDGYEYYVYEKPSGTEKGTYSFDGEYIYFYDGGVQIDRAHVSEEGYIWLDSTFDGYFYHMG